MEFEVFDGLTELLTGMENENFDSFFNSNNIEVTENNVSDTTNDNANVVTVSADLQEQDSNDDTLLDEDLDEVMENFLKRSEQIADENVISQNDRDALTLAALCEIEKTLALDDDDDDENKEQESEVKEVYSDSCPGKKHAVDVEQFEAEVFGGFVTPSGGDASWRTPGSGFSLGVLQGAGNHPRSHEPSWNSRNVNHVSAPYSGQPLFVRPGPRSHGVLGRRTSTSPSFISSSLPTSPSSGGGCNTPPSILLGGLVNVASFRSTPTSSSNNTLWSNLHGLTLEQPSSFSSISTSSYPPTQSNDVPQGGSSFGCDSGGSGSGSGSGGDGAIPQKRPEESGVGLSPQMSRFKDLMEKYKRVCNMSNTESDSTSSESDPPPRRRREAGMELPPGLDVVKRVRKSGKSKGQIDTYYIDKTTKQRFRSMQEIRRSITDE